MAINLPREARRPTQRPQQLPKQAPTPTPRPSVPDPNILQKIVDMAPTQPPVPTPRPDFNPLQNAIDAAPGAPPPVPTPRPEVAPPVPTPRPDVGALIPPITPGNTAAPPPDPLMGGMDPRAALAEAMRRQQAFGGRASEANYTTSAPGWAGGNTSAIFGRRK